MAKITSINVVEMAQEWKFEINKTGVNGFRKFIDAEAYSNVTEIEPATLELGLPNIGDSWDPDNYPNCRCMRIEVKYLQDCPISNGDGTWRYKTYSCFYESVLNDLQDKVNTDGEKFDPATPPTTEMVNSLLVSAEIGGQYASIVLSAADIAAGYGFKWKSDGTDVKQAMNKLENSVTYRLAKEVLDFSEFQEWSNLCVGKLNDATFLGCPIGTLRYMGASLDAYIAENGKRKFHAILNFEYKSITGEASPEEGGPDDQTDGWNFVIREDRTGPTTPWIDRPYWYDSNAGSNVYTYESVTFNPLIMAGSEEPSIPPIEFVTR